MVFQFVQQGLISEEEARVHPQSNVILSALGISDTVEPEITEVSYNKGDRFVLCTDGFWGMMPEPEFIHYIGGKGDLEETIVNTAKEIDSLGVRQGGGHDNLTAAVIDVKRNSKLKPKMRNSHIAILCSLVVLLLISIVLNVLICVRYQKQNNSSIIELFYQMDKKDKVEVEEVAP
jgi:protein phosphatase